MARVFVCSGVFIQGYFLMIGDSGVGSFNACVDRQLLCDYIRKYPIHSAGGFAYLVLCHSVTC